MAEPVIAENGITLPLIDVTRDGDVLRGGDRDSRSERRTRSTGTSSSSSARTASRPSDRVVLLKVLRAEEATITKPRPKTIPVVVFLFVIGGTIGLAFLLENLRPPVQLVADRLRKKDESVSLEPRRRVSLR